MATTTTITASNKKTATSPYKDMATNFDYKKYSSEKHTSVEGNDSKDFDTRHFTSSICKEGGGKISKKASKKTGYALVSMIFVCEECGKSFTSPTPRGLKLKNKLHKKVCK